MVTYELAGSDLVIRHEDGAVRWRGRPDGYPVKAVSPLERNEGAVVLLDYMSGPKNFANLLRVGIDGTVAWRASPPDRSGNDAFVEFSWEGSELVANSWSCYQVRIDPLTGTVTSQVFTK
jgi:hypothetical protein